MKFKKIDVILTDDDGYLALKALLPSGSILWVRNVEGGVIVRISEDVNLDYVEKSFNSLHRNLKMYD